jgi:hypothetical protein
VKKMGKGGCAVSSKGRTFLPGWTACFFAEMKKMGRFGTKFAQVA